MVMDLISDDLEGGSERKRTGLGIGKSLALIGDRKYRTGERPLGTWAELYEAEILVFLWPRSDG